MELQPYEYREDFLIYRHDGDFLGNIHPGTLFRYAQQIANTQCAVHGITDETYARTNTAFLLARQAFHITHMPHVDETVTLVTAPEQMHHAVNKRLTTVYDANGTELAFVDSRWVLVDLDKRTILRTRPPELDGPWASERLPRALPMRLKKPESTEEAGRYTAVYSRCDMNGHLNNSRYVDIVMDSLPVETVREYAAEDLVIYYHIEVPLGESFTLHRALLEENQWYFSGYRDDGTCLFEVNLTLRPRAELEGR